MSSWLNKSGHKQRRFIDQVLNPVDKLFSADVDIIKVTPNSKSYTINFITYGDLKYENALNRIKNEAIHTNWFNTVTIYRPQNLSIEFKNKFKNVLSQPRGGGYWIWKLDIIKQHLDKINDNDILVYCDSGCTINKNGEERFYEYIDMIANSDLGILTFQGPHIEKTYTTRDIFNYFSVGNTDIIETGQYVGGILILKKNNHLFKILDTYTTLLEYDENLITDRYNNNNQFDYFKDNRHDQSLTSVICKIYKSIVIPKDETWVPNFGDAESIKYPFWATKKN